MQCTCRVAGRVCQVAGWGQQWCAHCDLGHASTSRRVQQPAQHRTAGSLLHLQDYVHNNVIIIIDWALPAIRKPCAGAGVYRVHGVARGQSSVTFCMTVYRHYGTWYMRPVCTGHTRHPPAGLTFTKQRSRQTNSLKFRQNVPLQISS